MSPNQAIQAIRRSGERFIGDILRLREVIGGHRAMNAIKDDQSGYDLLDARMLMEDILELELPGLSSLSMLGMLADEEGNIGLIQERIQALKSQELMERSLVEATSEVLTAYTASASTN